MNRLLCLLMIFFSVQTMRAWAYTERYSLYNDTSENAENVGKITASGITISGSCSFRWQMQDDDYYKFTTSSSKLYYRVEIDSVNPSKLNKLYIVIKDSVTREVTVLVSELVDYSTQVGCISVIPNRVYYVHCYKQSHGGDVPYRFTLSASNISNGSSTGKCTVQFNGNGATSGKTASITMNVNQVKKLSANGFKKTGYVFKGWATTATKAKKGVVEFKNKDSVKSSGGGMVTLYAVWSANSYTVQFDGNGATSGKTAAMKLSYGQTKTLTANGFKKSGHSFKGWATSAANAKKGVVKYKNKASVKSLSAVHNKKVTLYAVWIANSYTVQFSGNGATSGKTAAMTLKYGQTKALTANGFKKSGHSFKGWATSAANAKKGVVKYKNKASVKSLSTVHNKKVTLYAVWSVNSYSLTVKPNSTNYGSASKSGKYKYASKVKLTAKPKKGYYFYGWYKSDKKTLLSKSASYIYKMGGTTTVYAWFKANAVKLGTAFKDSYNSGSKISTTVGLVSGKAKSIKVSGLPSGVLYTSGKISGTPTKTGVYTVKVTVVSADGATLTYTKKITVATPAMCVGTFYGFVGSEWAEEEFPELENEGTITFTGKSTGAVTAKVITPKGTYSFSGAGWTIPRSGATYSIKMSTKKGDALTLKVNTAATWLSMQATGSFVPSYKRIYNVLAQHNAFEKDSKGRYVNEHAGEVVSAVKGTYYYYAEKIDSNEWEMSCATSDDYDLKLTVGATGKTTLAGYIGNTKVSAASFVFINPQFLGDEVCISDFVFPLSKSSFLDVWFNLWFDKRTEDYDSGLGGIDKVLFQ